MIDEIQSEDKSSMVIRLPAKGSSVCIYNQNPVCINIAAELKTGKVSVDARYPHTPSS